MIQLIIYAAKNDFDGQKTLFKQLSSVFFQARLERWWCNVHQKLTCVISDSCTNKIKFTRDYKIWIPAEVRQLSHLDGQS